MTRLFLVAVLAVLSIHCAHATDLDCVSTTFNALSPNDKVCVSVFEDPEVSGVCVTFRRPEKADGVSHWG